MAEPLELGEDSAEEIAQFTKQLHPEIEPEDADILGPEDEILGLYSEVQ